MPAKLGLYLCSGCQIGDALDLEKLAKTAAKESKAAVCRTHAALCGEEGRKLILTDIEAGTVERAVVGACSSRFKTEEFNFDGSVIERVNLREHVAWSHKAQDEDTQMLAEDYLRMGVARLNGIEARPPLDNEISRALLVIGGGVTGITAALEAANAGSQVILVEKAASLGGFAAPLKKHFPTEPPYTTAPPYGLRAKVEAVLQHPNIRVLRSTHIARIEGQPGMFDVLLESESGQETVRAGAIIVATGWKPYDASRLGHLGYGITPDVVTNVELEAMAARGPIERPSDGGPVKSALFIQCAGSRDKDHLPYCSTACCMSTLTEVGYLREQDPEAEVYVIYKDMRTPGQYERYYREMQDQPLNFFMKGDVASVENVPDGRIDVRVNNTLFGQPAVFRVDLVVLATGMVPNGSDQILNLAYRQGPELPVLNNGFPDSHFVCFPYEPNARASTPRERFARPWMKRRRGRMLWAQRSKPSNPSNSRPRDGPCIRGPAIFLIPRSCCSAAHNVSGAPRNARSARSTKTSKVRPNSILIAAGAAASAWAHVRNGSFPSAITRWT